MVPEIQGLEVCMSLDSQLIILILNEQPSQRAEIKAGLALE